ncbi:phage tail protein [Brevundimonas sp.]|uniref:phage tail protein n=1 Tax=Brevundimonas sp. TaxID=1871086 RepID=UPI002D4BD7AB|nr:tail fiber protein [Brevundimonas sp.]HYC97588.1 tail fiber protein [Brevundimonas sp.]
MKRSGLRIAAAAAVAALGLAVFGAGSARAQDAYLGQLQQFGYNWCPDGWQRADGTLLSIAANSTLFSLLGTTFGGDGVTTFAVPDLRDRAPISQSNTLPIGAAVGASTATMLQVQMPIHTHGFNADPTAPVGNSPANSMLGNYPAGQAIYASAGASPNVPMNYGMVQLAGQSQPVSIQMPVLATNWCIALYGIYPPHP